MQGEGGRLCWIDPSTPKTAQLMSESSERREAVQGVPVKYQRLGDGSACPMETIVVEKEKTVERTTTTRPFVFPEAVPSAVTAESGETAEETVAPSKHMHSRFSLAPLPNEPLICADLLIVGDLHYVGSTDHLRVPFRCYLSTTSAPSPPPCVHLLSNM